MKIKELAKELEVKQADYTRFRKTIKALLDSGQLVRLKRNRIGLPDQLGVVVGTISINRSGTGFLIREGVEQDLLIPSHQLLTALDGDKVMVRLTGQRMGREAASVIKVVERTARNIVGLYRFDRHFPSVVPDNPRFHRDLYIPMGKTAEAKDGQRVVARLTVWDDPYRNPEGEIIEVLGYPNEPGVDMLTVMRSFNLPQEFPPDVMDEAEQASARLEQVDTLKREDLTGECIYTIDPVDAKDHDDAVSVERIAEGYRLGVHIADVSHFVQPGTALDTEAFDRGNSVYLPGMVIPMLPEVLSNNVCSLIPNRKRLAHSAIIDFDKRGKMLRWRLADTIIKSRAKLSYEDVQSLFDGNPTCIKDKSLVENLMPARELAQLLTQRRVEQGSLDFDLPEAKIILNDKGEVLELGHRVRLESHRLVEEFMLAANKAVALEVFRTAQPFLYRVHAKPDMEKVVAFSTMMSRLGHKFPVSKTMKPIQFAQFLQQVKDTPEEDFINELMLRSMQKAVYQAENIGHFGLAFTHYTHFTSPIRRYPDLLVHRLVRKLKGGHYPPAFAKRVAATVDSVGKHCSETERTAETAERQAVKVKQVAYMANHLGDEYSGVITGVTGHGFFVRLDNMGVEGMVRVSSIDDDYYLYEEDNFRIIGRRSKRIFRLGDTIRVGVTRADTTRNEIDLFVVEEPKPQKKAKEVSRPSGRRKGRPRRK
jgi:ribonuclease R